MSFLLENLELVGREEGVGVEELESLRCVDESRVESFQFEAGERSVEVEQMDVGMGGMLRDSFREALLGSEELASTDGLEEDVHG